MIEKIIQKFAENRSKMIDDICKIYIGSRKLTKEQIKRLELITEITPTGTKMYFKLKSGKLKKQSSH